MRPLLFLLACFALAQLPNEASAQSWPDKAVRIIAPFAPGGSADTLGRLVAAQLQDRLNQSFIVENKPGAGGAVGSEFVAKSDPDGYTFVVSGIASHVIAPNLPAGTPYDPVKDFTHVALFGGPPAVLAVNPSLPAKTLKEFIALAKAHPGKLEYGTTGVGTSPHLSFELFKSMTKTDITFIPYKTPALAHTDLLAGRISAQITNLPNHVDTVRAGKVRALGVTTATRSARMPDVPTIAEAGLPGYEVSSWYGMCAPIGVDKAIQNKIEADTLKALTMPESRHRLTDMGVDVEPQSSAEFTAFFRAEIAKWIKTAREAGIAMQ
jgi:tripartite-type tricarboxylate transporter receptor subunit TctC